MKAAAFVGWTAAIVGAAKARERFLTERDRIRWFETLKICWARGIERAFGIRVHMPAWPLLDEGKPLMVVANHRSPLDIVILMERFGGSFVSRDDVERWPLVGAAAKTAGTIFVDRKSIKSGIATIRAIRRELDGQGRVTLFPEGTTFRGDEVRPFHSGAFSAARAAKARIVPVGIAYPEYAESVDESFAAYFARMMRRTRIDVALVIGEPREIQGDATEVAGQARAAVQRLVHDARKLLPINAE